MDKRFMRGRTLQSCVAIGAGALCALTLAAPSFAAQPTPGVACVNTTDGSATDGEISGRGATFPQLAVNTLLAGYTSDVCGQTMVHYNETAYLAGGGNGSGAGRRAANWRADMFEGSDVPYDTATLNGLNGSCGNLGLFPKQPSTPLMPGATPDPCTDATAPVMTIPYVGGAIAFVMHLTTAQCAGSNPNSPALKFTKSQVSLLLGGDIKNWNDSRLRTGGNNGGLTNCNFPVSRVVRQDSSGSTQIEKNYLTKIDGLRTGAVCDPGKRWGVQPGAGSNPTDFNLDANNQAWPGGPNTGGTIPDVAATATCSAIDRSSATGNPALLTKLAATDGSVGYADLADAHSASGILLPQLQNSDDSAFVGPIAGTDANCSFGEAVLPGGGTSDGSVGLDPTDTWAYDQATPTNKVDVTNTGTKYPVCGLTWALIYTGLSDTSGGTNAISRMTANQRRTLYSYWTYVLSTLGQDRMSGIFFKQIPSTWVATLRKGFQDNF